MYVTSKPDVETQAFIQNSQDIFTVLGDCLTNSLLEYLRYDLTYEKLFTHSLSEADILYKVKHQVGNHAASFLGC